MISLLKWILKGVKNLARLAKKIGLTVGELLSSLVTWIAGAIYYIVDSCWDWFCDKFDAWLESATELVPDEVSSYAISPFTSYVADLFCFDVAIESLGVLISAFLILRLGRLLMVPVRAVLEVL